MYGSVQKHGFMIDMNLRLHLFTSSAHASHCWLDMKDVIGAGACGRTACASIEAVDQSVNVLLNSFPVGSFHHLLSLKDFIIR
jgi:hypothetical protein